MTPEIAGRLIRSEIQVGAQGPHFCMFVRDECLAIVPSKDGTFAGIGSTGLATDQGLAFLIYREGQPVLAGHAFEMAAEPQQVEKILRFSADLKTALGLE